MIEMGRRAILVAVMVWLTATHPVRADEIKDAIQEAIDAYEAGDYSAAAGQLDYAAQLVRQLKGQIQEFLPKPLDGWTAEESSSNAMAGSLFGGGVTASRDYRRGDSSVSITITGDLPILQGMLMMFTNPAIAAQGGARFQKINGHKAMVKTEAGDRGEITIVIGQRYLVQIEGRNVSKEELIAYAEAVDLDALAALQ